MPRKESDLSQISRGARRMKTIRAKESDEERQARLNAHREYSILYYSRATETFTERESRLSFYRERRRLYRAAKYSRNASARNSIASETLPKKESWLSVDCTGDEIISWYAMSSSDENVIVFYNYLRRRKLARKPSKLRNTLKSNPTGKELRDEAYLEHYTLKTVAEDEPLSLIKNPTHTDSETDSCSMKSEYEEFEEVICKKENDKEETTDCIDDIDNRNINNTDKTIKIEKIEENDTDSEEMRPYEDVNTNIHIKHEMIVKTEAYEEHGIDIEEMQLEFAVNTSDNTKLQIKDDNNDSNLETDLVPDAPTRKRKTAKKVLERKWRRRN